MPFIEEIEYGYVLDHLTFLREYDESNFIRVSSGYLNDKRYDFMIKKINHCSNVIEVGMDTIQDINLSRKDMSTFLSNQANLYKLNKDSLTVSPIYSMDDITIKHQYLDQYVKLINSLISKTLDGSISEKEEKLIESGELSKKVKKQIVNSRLDLDGYDSVKDFIKQSGFADSKSLNETYVKKELSPFIFKFEKQKNDLLDEAEDVLNSIKEAETNFDHIFKAVNNTKKEYDKDLKDEDVIEIDRFIYNIMRDYLEVIGYVSLVMTHKMTLFSKNVSTAETCYNTIKNRCMVESGDGPEFILFPTDNDSLADDLENGRTSAYEYIADQLYEYHSTNPMFGTVPGDLKSTGDLLHSRFSAIANMKTYNNEVYKNILGMYSQINDGLDVLEENLDDYLIVVKDLRNASGFTLPLEVRFQRNLDQINDLTHYSNDISGVTDDNKFFTVLSEVKDFGNNMKDIANLCSDVKSKIIEMNTRVDNNVNGDVTDMESLKELQTVTSEIMDQFHKINNIVAKSFMDRLKKLGSILTSVTIGDEIPNTDTRILPDISLNYDARYEGFIDDLDRFEEESVSRMNELEDQHYKMKSMKLRGVFVESENPYSL